MRRSNYSSAEPARHRSPAINEWLNAAPGSFLPAPNLQLGLREHLEGEAACGPPTSSIRHAGSPRKHWTSCLSYKQLVLTDGDLRLHADGMSSPSTIGRVPSSRGIIWLLVPRISSLPFVHPAWFKSELLEGWLGDHPTGGVQRFLLTLPSGEDGAVAEAHQTISSGGWLSSRAIPTAVRGCHGNGARAQFLRKRRRGGHKMRCFCECASGRRKSWTWELLLVGAIRVLLEFSRALSPRPRTQSIALTPLRYGFCDCCHGLFQ